MRNLGLVPVLILALAAPAAAADALQQARQSYDDMEFDAALAALDIALRGGGLEAAGLVEAYRLRGLSLSALERLDEALDAFRRMLSIDPQATIPPDTSPKLAAPFYQAVAMSKDLEPIGLRHTPPAPGSRAGPLAAEVQSDPEGLVRAVRLVHRAPGGAWQRGAPQVVGPALTFERPAGEVVEYCLEALDDHGNLLARAGSLDKPFSLRAPAPKPAAKQPEPKPGKRSEPPAAVAEVADAPRDGLREEDEEAPAIWYESWWFWTVVGAVVVGTGLGVGLGVGLSGDGSGPRDYSIEVR